MSGIVSWGVLQIFRKKGTVESHGHTFQGHRLGVEARYRDSIDRYSGS